VNALLNSLLPAVLAASLVGSMHCAGMCGPFLAFVVGAGRGSSAARLQVAYHGARGAGYALLGAAAGATGQLVDLAGLLAGLEPLAAAIAGATLLLIGIGALLRLAGLRLSAPRLGVPARAARLLRDLQARALRLPPTSRALAIGATTTFLPCGWLYAFAVTAAGTAHPLRGLAVMLVFWAGTLPILVFLGAAVRGAGRAFGPRTQALASLALVVLGLWTLLGRAALAPFAIARDVEARASLAHEDPLDEVRAPATPTPGAPLPCCTPTTDDGSPRPPASSASSTER